MNNRSGPRPWVLPLLAMVFLSGPAVYAAERACLVAPAKDRATVQAANAKPAQRTLDRVWEYENCQPFQVLEGTVIAYFEDAAGKLRDLSCTAGNACPVAVGASGGWPRPHKYVSALLAKKMGEDTERIDGLPEGRVLSPKNAAVFDFDRAGIADWALTVTAPGSAKLQFEARGVGGKAEIPVDFFKQPGRYRWKLRSGSAEMVRTVTLLGAAEAEKIDAQLAAISADTELSDAARRVKEMAVYFANDLDLERHLAERAAGLSP